ncbi:MAG: PfkB family carbohydrate kinase [candidate division KSB1 bacterium]|nr:PfkB family carbohydrate kinase [candidate division KSB1 bacterium]
MSKKSFLVGALGEAVWDDYGGKRFIGGGAANFCIHAAAMGCRSVLFSRIGHDREGRELKEALARRSVDTSALQIDLFLPTPIVSVALDGKGYPHYTCPFRPTIDEIRLDSIWEETAPQLDGLYFSMRALQGNVSSETGKRFLQMADKAVKLFDPELRSWDPTQELKVINLLNEADILKLDLTSCGWLKIGLQSEEDEVVFLHRLIETFGFELAALTLGEYGCYLVSRTEEVYDPGYFVTQRDASGAGDAFAAALLVKFLEGAPLTETADFANLLGAWVASHPGAAPAWVPEDLESFAWNSL